MAYGFGGSRGASRSVRHGFEFKTGCAQTVQWLCGWIRECVVMGGDNRVHGSAGLFCYPLVGVGGLACQRISV